MTQQFGFRASRSLAEIENRNTCWDNLGIDRRDLPLLVGTSAAGVTAGDYFNCKDLSSSLEVQISGLSIIASSGLTAMLGKISKNGDSGVGTISGSALNNDRAYYNSAFDIISASTNSYFSPVASGGYGGESQYLLGTVTIPNLTISGFNFRGETKTWSDYFVKYRNYFRIVDSGGTVRYSPLYLAPPTALSSNVLWLDAEYSSFVLDGSNVRQWTDVLGRANAGQTETAYRPTIAENDIYDKRGVRFTTVGADSQFLNLGTLGGVVPTEATLIIAVSLSSAASAGDTVYSLVSSLANISSAWRSGTGNGNWGLFTSSIISNFPASMPANGTLVMSVRASTAYGLELRINGVRHAFRSPGTYTYSSAGNFVIGVSDSVSRSNALRGSIHSLALFNRILTDAELNSQEQYLQWRYGFIFDPDSAPLSFTKLLHDEQTTVFLLEDNSPLETD